MQALPFGTTTFLFTDIEGSIRLWQTHPDAMPSALARHDALLRGCVEHVGGHVFKTVGDGMYAVFAGAAEALQAAVQAQHELEREVWPGGIALRVRMALHTGNAEQRGDDYYGPVPNRTARLLALGSGGQILLSAATCELVRDTLPDGVRLRNLGTHPLRDMARDEQVYQVVHSDLADDFPVLRSLGAIPHNLPQQITSFIGRGKEMEEVRARLARPGLLTLTGAGGSGKTRLALQAASEAMGDYPDGVWLVELASLSDAALVPQTVGATLGIQEQAGHGMEQTLLTYCRDKRLLMILDNCEHLLPGCAPFAAHLLRTCPNARLLITSREPLGITGEQTYRVPSLSLPNPQQARAAIASGLGQFDAVRLFIERARLVQSDFTVTDQNAPALAQLCYHLDGIPLAIELAAARVRSLTVEDMNRRLDSRFRLLTGGDRSALPRQQTLRSLVDWSYGLLNPSEKTLLARLSVFAGGWTLPAAEAICGFAALEDGAVLDLLTSLVDKSLVLAEQSDGTTRYRMLETLRQYAAEKLSESDDTSLACQRHRDWFLALAEDAEPQILGAEQGIWLRRLETEHDNLRCALDGCASDADSLLVRLRLAGALAWFWQLRGYRSEGRDYLTRAIAQARTQEAGAAVPPRVLAKALHGAGYLAYAQGDYKTARPLYEEALTLRRHAQDTQGIAGSLNNLGLPAQDQGDLLAARQLYEEALTLRRRLGHPYGIAATLNNLGNIAYSQGAFDQARALQEESLTLRRTVGDKIGIATSLNNLGNIAYSQGDYGEARRLYEESLLHRRDLDDKQGIASSLSNLGLIAHGQGDFTRAQSLHDEALTLFRELEDLSGTAAALSNLGTVQSSQGHVEAARALHTESLDLRRTLGDKQGIAISLSNLGLLATAQTDYPRAHTLHAESLNLFQSVGDKNGVAYALEGLAAVCLAQHQATRAVVLFAVAHTLRQAIGSPLPHNEQAPHDARLAQARARLGLLGFARAWDRGSALSPTAAAAI